MKRLMMLILLLVQGALLVACGGSSDGGDDHSPSQAPMQVVARTAMTINKLADGRWQVHVQDVGQCTPLGCYVFNNDACVLEHPQSGVRDARKNSFGVGVNKAFAKAHVLKFVHEGRGEAACEGYYTKQGAHNGDFDVTCWAEVPKQDAGPTPAPSPRTSPSPTPSPSPSPGPSPSPTPAEQRPPVVHIPDQDLNLACSGTQDFVVRVTGESGPIESIRFVAGPQTGSLNQDGNIWWWTMRPCHNNGQYTLRVCGPNNLCLTDFSISVNTAPSCGC